MNATVIAGCVLAAVLAVAAATAASEVKVVRAPVVAPAVDGVMVQIGWFTYEARDDIIVLYCTPTGAVTLSCVVYITTPKGNGITVAEGLTASEARS